MDKPLTLTDIDAKVRDKVYTQSYNPPQLIEGVKIIQIKHVVGEDGDFSELIHLNGQGELAEVQGFKMAQINRSTQFPGSIKAWHLHFAQDELWYVPAESHLLAGLWDVRQGSKTAGLTNRIALGGNSNRLLYIPRGVAHGSANLAQQIGIIIYFINKQFDPTNPDEQRLPWDSLGANFWQAERD